MVRIGFKVTFSVCCHPKILLPWQRDVTTSLYYRERPNKPRGGGVYLILGVQAGAFNR